MVKWLIGIILGLVVLSVLFIFLFIPKSPTISRGITYYANQPGVFSFLSDTSNWQHWWPGQKMDGALALDGSVFRLQTVGYNVLDVTVETDGRIENSGIHILPIGNDSVNIVWQTTLPPAANPLSRVRQFLESKKLARKFAQLLIAIKKHTSSIQNIYGADIKRGKIHTEYMVSIKKSYTRRPTDIEIYDFIKQIRGYIATQQATEEDHPFFNITEADSSRTERLVGVPVTAQVPDAGIFLSKKLLRNGNMISAEVTGGQHKVDMTMLQFEKFIADYRLQKVALPFQSFLNNRLTTDSSKWVTRIVYPIL